MDDVAYITLWGAIAFLQITDRKRDRTDKEDGARSSILGPGWLQHRDKHYFMYSHRQGLADFLDIHVVLYIHVAAYFT